MSISSSAHLQNAKLFQRTPLLDGANSELKRAEIRQYFHATFDRYEQLFESLACDAAYFEKSISLRHPLIFYFGHTATFFVNKLLISGLIKQRINPRFESMFAVGVDEMSWDDLSVAHYDWPSVAEVKSYRDQVRGLLDKLICETELTLPIHWSHPWWAILMGIEHERIHLETSSVLIRQHQLSYVKTHPAWPVCQHSGVAPKNNLLEVAAGTVRLGNDQQHYGWDNEYGQHQAEVAAFKASQFLVSNGEYLSFVEAGGYTQTQYWEEEGKAWLLYTQAQHPTFWLKQGEQWRLRLMLQEIDMPWDWPVEVNYHEAKAFCNWKNVRLPSEDEWHRLYDQADVADANLHLDHYASSCPVTSFRQGDFYDVMGNVWQWTETPIYPFDGFAVHPYYDDFSTPTFDNRHNLIKGGSWISCGNEVLVCSRYAFRRHFFQHAGFRYVLGEAAKPTSNNVYETDKQLSEYAEFHYGDEYYGVANFPKTLAQLAIRAMGNKPAQRALDLGCATGRASFELARHFDHVTGIDFSARFINMGVQLSEQGRIRYTLSDEGELVSYYERNLSDLDLADSAHKVEFYQGDACNLKAHFTGYDLILAANLIDRLYNPRSFLQTIHQRLNLGGLLVITSPYTWLTEHTPREQWLGGYKKDGENYSTLDALREILAEHFSLVQEPVDVPFVIRETRRKFQHSLSEVTVWEKRG